MHSPQHRGALQRFPHGEVAAWYFRLNAVIAAARIGRHGRAWVADGFMDASITVGGDNKRGSTNASRRLAEGTGVTEVWISFASAYLIASRQRLQKKIARSAHACVALKRLARLASPLPLALLPSAVYITHLLLFSCAGMTANGMAATAKISALARGIARHACASHIAWRDVSGSSLDIWALDGGGHHGSHRLHHAHQFFACAPRMLV